MTTVDSPQPAHIPVADSAQVCRSAAGLITPDLRSFVGMILLNALAAVTGLVSPWLLGRIVNEVQGSARLSVVDELAATIVAFAVAQLVLTRFAEYVSTRFGERIQARVREQFLDRALSLPASVVERAGTGDLAARGTGDVTIIGTTLRSAAPVLIVATLQALVIAVAVFVVNPLLGACGLVGLVGVGFISRWYLRRARPAYLAEGATTSALAEMLSANATGARTIEALGLQQRRRAVCDQAIDDNRAAQLRTLFLRNVLFPSVDLSYVIPVVLVLLVGGLLLDHGPVSLGAVVTSALYLRQLSQPLDTIMMWLEQLQQSAASFARVEGLAGIVRPTGSASGAPATPDGDRIEIVGVHYAYGDNSGARGPDVVTGVDLSVQPGERLALVGPSGAGKTTLGKLIAGIDRPRTGAVTVGGVPVADLDPEQLRRQVVLVTQEQHLFLGTVRDNLQLASPQADDTELASALATVGADWADDLPDGLDTELGGQGFRIDAAQVQQLALARVILADPHTLILDEATALLDPRTARRTERALSAVLVGRTVIAIAHRLHTAHDASRVAVMDQGRLTEIGTHAELVSRGGSYAALWHSWHGDPPQ